MAIKKNLIDDPILNISSSITSPGLGGLKDLFKPEELLSDERSITVLKPLKILGFHKRVVFVEKDSQKNSVFIENFSVTVPAGTVHIHSSIEDLHFAYGEFEFTLLGNGGYRFHLTNPRRDQFCNVSVAIKVEKIGDLHLGGGQPPILVRTADVKVILIVHSGKHLPPFGAGVALNLLFLGEE